MSECERTRQQLLDFVRGRLSEAERLVIERHLQGCAECQRVFARERELERALRKRPFHALPSSLRSELEARLAPSKPRRSLSRAVFVLSPLALGALLLGFGLRSFFTPSQQMLSEAVNDHLRVLYAERPIEIESGGIHQVKPWFSGRLDFAPAVSFSGDDEFPLQGGAISWFIDRKAASFIFKHKLHTITLFVFRSEGLDWPVRGNVKLGALSGSSGHLRGFNTLLWRDADLGYALVSDVDAEQLSRLALKIGSH